MNATHSLAIEQVPGLSWTKLVVSGIAAAVAYFTVKMTQRRRFYKDMVSSNLSYTTINLPVLLMVTSPKYDTAY